VSTRGAPRPDAHGPAQREHDETVAVKPRVEAFLAERGLQLSHEKTQIIQISEDLDLVGQHVRKYGGKLLINRRPRT
jgi:hypothetical protein